MQNTYYFIAKVAEALRKKLINKDLLLCFSQNKDELILGFADAYDEFWLRATLTDELTCLSFPNDYDRARRNSVNLFEQLIGQKVIDIEQFSNERAFGLHFGAGRVLVFKLFGRGSNVVLFDQEKAIELFRHKLERDWHLKMQELHRHFSQTQADFLSLGMSACFPTISKEMRLGMGLEDYAQAPLEQWKLIQAFLQKWQAEPVFYLLKAEGQAPQLSFFEEKNTLLVSNHDVLQISNDFYKAFTGVFFVEIEKQNALKELNKRQKQTDTHLRKNQERLKYLKEFGRYEEIGHLIMANLHLIPPRAKSVELMDFYNNSTLQIPLKEDASPQKNAENYYRKAKNQKIEIQKITEVIASREAQWLTIEAQKEQVQAHMQSRELRAYLKQIGLIKADSKDKNSKGPIPFKHTDYEGFNIWIGKNSQNNDLLTQKYAYKEDLWLHARDVSGSHVIIRYKAGKPFPNSVIQRAAELAAYYSKRRTDSLCPVIVTPKKFVRKPKGAPAGAVVVDKETTVMVEPKGLNDSDF